MKISRRIAYPVLIVSLCVNAISYRSTSELADAGGAASPNSPTSSADVAQTDTSSAKTDTAKTDAAETDTKPTQTYAGATQPNLAQQADSIDAPAVPIQVSQNRFDASCTSLYAYDPNDTYVNVRDSPNGEILTSVDNFTTIQSTDDSINITADGWNKIYTGHRTVGYVHSDLIRTKLYRVYDPSDTSANLRATPNGKVIAAVKNDSVVKFAGIEGDWTRVVTRGGSVGYVSTTLLDAPPC